MMSNYTKGPWSCNTFIDDTIKDSKGNEIADPYIGGESTTIAEMDANANLIAAAPDMLIALERILKYQTNDPYIDDICKRAINKAKGE